MTDTHCHILYGLDDGSHGIEESIELIEAMKSIGFNNLILTPHYIKGSEYSANNELKESHLDKLKEALKERNIKMNLYLGNEIFIATNILELLEKKEITSLNNTKYLLIELPFHNQINHLNDIIYEIKIHGYIPVIAHPERYTYFQENPHLVDELREEEVLFQCNYSSIIGYYGHSAEKLLKYLLKNKYVDFFGSDMHHLDKGNFTIKNFPKIIKHIRKITGEDYLNEIINNCNSLVSKVE